MNDELVPFTNPNLTFEEFKQIVFPKSLYISDKVADAYGSLPTLIKSLSNLDPTGITAYFTQILNENQTQRENENISYALYQLFLALSKIKAESINREQFPALSYLYLEHSKQAYRKSKIELLRNIWFNGIIDKKDSLEIKANIFNLLSTLTEDDVRILKLIHEKQNSIPYKDRKGISKDFIAEELKIDADYTQQLCIALQGKGLLFDANIGWMDYNQGLANGPCNFSMTNYVLVLAEYFKDPI